MIALYSSMAHVRQPLKRFHEYHSIETATAFVTDFWVDMEVGEGGPEDDDTTEDTASDSATNGDTTDNHDGDTELASDTDGN